MFNVARATYVAVLGSSWVAKSGGTPLKGMCSLFLPWVLLLHWHPKEGSVCTLHALELVGDCIWLDPCDEISSTGFGAWGLLGGTGGGSGGGGGMGLFGVLSGINCVVVGMSVGRQGGLRSNLRGMVLLKLHITTPPWSDPATSEPVALYTKISLYIQNRLIALHWCNTSVTSCDWPAVYERAGLLAMDSYSRWEVHHAQIYQV